MIKIFNHFALFLITIHFTLGFAFASSHNYTENIKFIQIIKDRNFNNQNIFKTLKYECLKKYLLEKINNSTEIESFINDFKSQSVSFSYFSDIFKQIEAKIKCDVADGLISIEKYDQLAYKINQIKMNKKNCTNKNIVTEKNVVTVHQQMTAKHHALFMNLYMKIAAIQLLLMK